MSDRDVLQGLQRQYTPGGNVLPSDPNGKPTAGRKLAGSVVPLTGVGNGEDAIVTGQIFCWQALPGEACECVLHFRGQYLGQSFSYNAGGELAADASGNIESGYLEITYGVASMVNTVRIDAKPGAYQLPACDFVQCNLWAHISSGEAAPVVMAAGGLAQGTYPTARPPTWTASPPMPEGDPITFTGPRNARAVDLQWQPFTGDPLPDPFGSQWAQLTGYAGNSDQQTIITSLDGTRTYPPYSPVPLSDARDAGVEPQWTISVDSGPAKPLITFFIAF